MAMNQIMSYQALCKNLENDPTGTNDTMLYQVKLTMWSWDANRPESQDEVALLHDVLLDFAWWYEQRW